MNSFLKGLYKGVLFWIYAHLAILLQLYLYDNISVHNKFSSTANDLATWGMPIVSGIIAYFIFAPKPQKSLGFTALGFFAVSFVVSGLFFVPSYYSSLFNLVANFDETYYELGINAYVDIILHNFFCVVALIIQFVRNRKLANK